MLLRLSFIYLQESLRWRRRFPGTCTVAALRTFFGRWRRSLRRGANALDDGSPWMTFAAIEFLDQLVSREMRLLEYGSGGSSLFFSRRVRELVSVEHEAEWASRVRERTQAEKLGNARLLLVPPEADPHATGREPSDPDGYTSSDTKFQGYSFVRYASAIDEFPAAFFEVVIIDGRARPSCFKHALPKVPVGGWLVLDNSERAVYQRIHAALNGPAWRKLVFNGPGPYNQYFWQTCAWQKLR